LEGLGALIASIGGAGTFDGVFVTGIVAVLSADRSIGDQPKPKYRAPQTAAPSSNPSVYRRNAITTSVASSTPSRYW
jgi:hypothetical protein